MSGFSFLSEYFPALEKLGVLAESYLYSDPNACLYKLGALSETVVNYTYEPAVYTLPENERSITDYDRLVAENERITGELAHMQAAAISSSVDTTVNDRERRERRGRATGRLRLTEAETRVLIDEQLRRVGWEADTTNLRYSKGTRPQKGKNLAIAEWPTDSTGGTTGYADYALFVGLRLVGVIEAKAAHVDIPSVVDNQCREYGTHIKDEHSEYVISTWGNYKVPFLFATNGRAYLKQLETRSGISRPKRLYQQVPHSY